MDFGLLPDFMQVFEALSHLNPVDATILGLNLLALIFAKSLLLRFGLHDGSDQQFLYRLRVFRLLNLLVFAVYGHWFVAAQSASAVYADYKALMVLGVLYAAYLFDFVVHYFIQLRFGKVREVDGDKKLIETYNSRLLSIMARVLIFIIVLITVVRMAGFESTLEAGGIIGFIGVFLALTQNSWAPDIFSGLIILNSGAFEEGDVIEIPGSEGLIGVVFKTKMFHTEILDMVNNHRVMVRNARLREYVLHNLSRFASAKGLREKLSYNVGYHARPDDVRAMFQAAFDEAAESNDCIYEPQHGIEVAVTRAGDYAVEWSVFYFIKNVRRVLAARYQMNELIVSAAAQRGIELATPVLNDVSVVANESSPA